jgi:lipoprotein-releasing system ATP-binding protein
MNNSLYSCRGLNKRFIQASSDIQVISNLDLEIEKGSTLSVVGPSGCGKTTLLHMLAGLDHPTSGNIDFLDKSFNTLSSDSRAKIRNKEMGFVYQFHHLLPEFNAKENVALPLMMAGAEKTESLLKASDLLKQVNLSDRMLNRPGELSGGERQRVAIARALINNPSCLLMDEPTGDLDKKNAEIISDLFLNLVTEKNISLIIATHDITLASRLDRTLNLELD